MSNLEPMQDCARVGLVGSLLKIMEMAELPCFHVVLHSKVLGSALHKTLFGLKPKAIK